jgi:hypothetical protein
MAAVVADGNQRWCSRRFLRKRRYISTIVSCCTTTSPSQPQPPKQITAHDSLTYNTHNQTNNNNITISASKKVHNLHQPILQISRTQTNNINNITPNNGIRSSNISNIHLHRCL